MRDKMLSSIALAFVLVAIIATVAYFAWNSPPSPLASPPAAERPLPKETDDMREKWMHPDPEVRERWRYPVTNTAVPTIKSKATFLPQKSGVYIAKEKAFNETVYPPDGSDDAFRDLMDSLSKRLARCQDCYEELKACTQRVKELENSHGDK